MIRGKSSPLKGEMAIHAPGKVMAETRGDHVRLAEILFGTCLLGFLFLADIVSTQCILVMGGRELNLFMVPVVLDPVFHVIVKLFVLCLVALAAIYCNSKVRGAGSVLMILVVTFYAVVFSFNLRAIFQMVLLGTAA